MMIIIIKTFKSEKCKRQAFLTDPAVVFSPHNVSSHMLLVSLDNFQSSSHRSISTANLPQRPNHSFIDMVGTDFQSLLTSAFFVSKNSHAM